MIYIYSIKGFLRSILIEGFSQGLQMCPTTGRTGGAESVEAWGVVKKGPWIGRSVLWRIRWLDVASNLG